MLVWLYSMGVQLRREEDPWLARPPSGPDPAITSYSTIFLVAKKEKNFPLPLKNMGDRFRFDRLSREE